MIAGFDLELVRANRGGSPCGEPKTMAVRESSNVADKEGSAPAFWSREHYACANGNLSCCTAAKKAGALVNNNESTSAAAFAMQKRSRGGAMRRKYQGRWNRSAAAARRGNDGEADACRSLLIPRAHFGAAGGAAVLAFGAGRFLPLAGPTGSSCA